MVNNRPRGILTEADREFLRMDGEKRLDEYSRPNRSQRWDKIEERIWNGVMDFHVIYHHLPADSREDVFRPIVEMMFPWAPVNLLEDSFGFQLLGVLEQQNRDLDDEEFYKTVFEGAIERTLGRSEVFAEVTVDVSIDGWAPHDDLVEHRDLSDLEPEMIRSLWNADRISHEEVEKALSKADDE